MANPHLLDRGQDLLLRLGQLMMMKVYWLKFCISTPCLKTLYKPLVDIFGYVTPTMYYSCTWLINSFADKMDANCYACWSNPKMLCRLSTV